VVVVTFDYELTLINLMESENELGDPISAELPPTYVWCDKQSVTRAEHYAAAQHGLKPEIVFVVNQYEYAGQKQVEFEGSRYRVIRTYHSKTSKGISDFETIELVCQGAINRG
jgi:SPP1 family predicted phage head-tail adaptor